jgi:shikimate dehydrogenase
MTERTPLSSKGGPYRLGVIGDPVAHSLSPSLHQPALDQLGIPATYERWHTTADEIEDRFASLRHPAVLGANVTVPHKIAALRLSDEISPAAARAGAVNTVVNRDGVLFGDNTDIVGFAMSLTEATAGCAPETALVLGAGGAARAVVLALEELGVAEIVIANRDLERAAKLASELSPAPVRAISLVERSLAHELPRTGLLVNATSLGWHRGELPLEARLLDLLPGEAIVADLTYRDTDLLVAASARSLRTLDGLAMLVYQGARAFELFTGHPAPVPTMLAAAQRARDSA